MPSATRAAEICRVPDGAPEPDPDLRDTERVPLVEGDDPVDGDGLPASVRAFFEREVRPHVPDAWIDTSKRDPIDGKVGMVGYEINFNRYFYRYKPPRALDEIQADIEAVEVRHRTDASRHHRHAGRQRHEEGEAELPCDDRRLHRGTPFPRKRHDESVMSALCVTMPTFSDLTKPAPDIRDGACQFN